MSPSLKDAVTAHIEAQGGGEGFFPAADGLAFIRTSRENLPQHMLYRPALCVVVQGAKQVMFGDSLFDFAEMQALIVSVELPAFSRVMQASPDRPFLAITAEFDVAMMRSVMEQLETPPKPSGDFDVGVFVTDLDARLADCMQRLVRMLETPRAVPILHPSIMREICFWLLAGPHGDRICKLALPDSHTRRIADAIHILREDFARAIRIDELAAAARMSPSSFHQHFKTLTSMTPLQYQKHLRLLQARRLMVADGTNAANAAYEVGYESASQFSREYARMFGAPPRRDIAELKSLPA
jgi:AraC-like DNA-binding protein